MTDEPIPTPSESPRPSRADRVRGLVSGASGWLGDLRASFGGFPFRRLLKILLVLPVVVYLLSGVYVVNPGEAAVVRRFGAVIQPRVTEGLSYRLPWPIDRVDIVNVATVRRESVGVTEPTGEDHVHDEPMNKFRALTGDTNIIDVEVIVQYQVRDPADFLLNVDYPPYRIIRETVRGSVTNLIAGLPVDEILTTERQRLQDAIRVDAQGRLDDYRSGLAIVSINLQKAYPPDEVADAFRDVASAGEDRAKAINESQGYANSVVPQARGEAQQILAAANAYAAQAVNAAKGAAQAFESVLSEYKSNSQIYGRPVTLYRYYLETIEKILPRVRVYVVNNANGEQLNLRLIDGSSTPAQQTTTLSP
ncbi:MAG TPA: FtsH protease activity modulator HflK [Anaerolineae bacterium]|nr:FtsH protease activity modulator HflK [Anaerolineae bacterium]